MNYMIQLILKRVSKTNLGTFGVLLELVADGEVPYCVTLEPVVPIIVPGKYYCTKYLSPKRGYEVYLLNNVPGHSFVEIHVGNTIKDTEGCILVGSSFAPIVGKQQVDGISMSKITFKKLMSDFDNTIELEVRRET